MVNDRILNLLITRSPPELTDVDFMLLLKTFVRHLMRPVVEGGGCSE